MLKKYIKFLIITSVAFFLTDLFSGYAIAMFDVTRHIFFDSRSYANEILACCLGGLWISTIAFANFSIQLKANFNGTALSAKQKTFFLVTFPFGVTVIVFQLMLFGIVRYLLEFFIDWFVRGDFLPMTLVKSHLTFILIVNLTLYATLAILALAHMFSNLYFRVHTKTKEKKALNVFLKAMILILTTVVIVALSLAAFSAVYWLGGIYLLSDLYPSLPPPA